MFNQAKADAICECISAGKSLRKTCAELNFPLRTIFDWVRANPEFSQQYARAMDDRADALAEELQDIADDPTIEPNDKRIRVDARKWIASKLKPKRYGDRLQHEGDMTLNIKIHDPAKLLRDK